MSSKHINILSIDVGIKNLACCFLSVNREKQSYKFLKWDVLDLCKETNSNLSCSESGCKRSVAYKSVNDLYFCNIHSKKCKYQIPKKEDKISFVNKLKIDELKKYCAERLIFIESSDKKNVIIKKVKEYLDKNCLEKVKKDNANKFTLIDIGKNMVTQMNQFLLGERVDKVLIENQISPIANRMKTIQGMIAQYFIMKGVYDIDFINASNKLKLFSDKKTTYKERKKLSIEITNDLLNKLPEENKYLSIANIKNNTIHNEKINIKTNKTIVTCESKLVLNVFNTHKKQDDLADSFLQLYWYIRENKYI